ncbi:MAG: carboxypeptidase-like regulatory domain-containing protein [Flavobacteriaceae bacterium]
MKTALNISVKKPCHENFDTFKSTKKGGFCGNCQKEVIDFSKMSDSQIIDVIRTNNGSLCGRLSVAQLHRPIQGTSSGLLRRSMGFAAIALLGVVGVPTMQAQGEATVNTRISKEVPQQKYVVRGVVYDELGQPMPGVNVVLKQSNEGVATDLEGKFEFSRPLEVGEILVFSYLGFEPKEYKVVQSDTSTIDVTITFETSDVLLMGDISVDEVYSSKRAKRSKSRPRF